MPRPIWNPNVTNVKTKCQDHKDYYSTGSIFFLITNIRPSAKITKSIVSNLVRTINYNTVSYVIWRFYKEKWVQILIIALCNKEYNEFCLQCFISHYQCIFIIATNDPSGLLAVHCTFFLRCKKKATSNSGNLIRENSHEFMGTINYRR